MSALSLSHDQNFSINVLFSFKMTKKLWFFIYICTYRAGHKYFPDELEFIFENLKHAMLHGSLKLAMLHGSLKQSIDVLKF